MYAYECVLRLRDKVPLASAGTGSNTTQIMDSEQSAHYSTKIPIGTVRAAVYLSNAVVVAEGVAPSERIWEWMKVLRRKGYI